MTSAGILLLTLGLAGSAWGAMFLFNFRRAANKAAERRNAVRAVTAARTVDLGLTQPSMFGAWFFRLVGGIVLPAGLFLAFVGLALTVAE
ncbi:hypothetical protein ACFU51_16985 [Streptomyces sp. NPDC057430]|uniref:hypothetical protein n=1 Tax=Streptomyces sp. NPDC057430 TaxID=3346131 RepID=UPI0036B37C88